MNDSVKPRRDVALFDSALGTEMNIRVWDAMLNTHPKAILLKTFGSGSIAGVFIQKVHETVRKGTPVFLLNGVGENLGLTGQQDLGITKQSYGTNEELLNAGAVALESVNVTHLERMNKYILEKEAGVVANEYQGKPTDNVFKTISDIANEGGDMFEIIRKVREVYNLSEEQIAFIEMRTHRLEPNVIPAKVRELLSAPNAESPNIASIPITRESIMRSRGTVDTMLKLLEQEISRERMNEIKPMGKLS